MVIPLTYGRMGNYLFQVAATAGYAWRHGLEFTVPTTTDNPKWNPIYLQHLANPNYRKDLPQIKLEEKVHSYQELPYDSKWKDSNIVLDGYWQTEKYFKEYRERLLAAFAFPYQKLNGVVSVHVRRTDYLILTKKHPPITVEWIEQSMKQFPSFSFMFFSDDIPWCRATFGSRGDCSFSEGCSELTDMTKMSQCEHQICSASTYSWWSAWLNRNPNKRVIMPKLWFVPGHGGLDVSDIVPAEWERR